MPIALRRPASPRLGGRSPPANCAEHDVGNFDSRVASTQLDLDAPSPPPPRVDEPASNWLPGFFQLQALVEE